VINLVVVKLRGAPVGRAVSAQFGPAGGTIGRADTNTLVLDDPDRTVSRVHAQVLCRGDQFFVVDRGSNPMVHNGAALGSGKEALLADGDRLTIGGFELSVQQVVAATDPLGAFASSPGDSAATDDDPFADLLAGLGRAAPPAPAHRAAPEDASPLLDPFAGGAGGGSRPTDIDPFADLLAPAPSAAAKSSGGAGALDDFSDMAAPPAGKAAGIDALFGGTGSGSGMGGDPLAHSPLADPVLQPNTSGANDPFAALQGNAQVAPAARSDHLPIGQYGYVPPKATTPAIAAPAPLAEPLPRGAPMAAAALASTPASSPDALLVALLRGLGTTHQMPEALTPELMERIGALLRGATEGTLQLLLARQQLKREVRAEVTMISAEANNPLKFSPSAEAALAHLLGQRVRGFMGPEAAMRDAYDDLRAHEFGVMVGMRAALAHVLERFAPDELEKKIAAKSALDSLFAANRKAKLWDQFIALYAGIASEAEDDFHTLFGKAFLQAYEEQMARLKSRDG
jgi:FHA domain-containing protein